MIVVNHLKMPSLYGDAVIICHKVCSMLSILNELTLRKELERFMTNNVLDKTSRKTIQQKTLQKELERFMTNNVLDKKSRKTIQKNENISSYQSHESNPEPLGLQSHA